jgi:heme exporter protein B
MSGYLADVAVLARKDLVLELRARDTIPAMLLFVLSTLVVFHFVLPTNASALAAKGLLWVAIVFTALLGLSRAFAAEREQGLIDGLVLAPSDRSAIWLGKAAAMLAFLVLAEMVALPAFALFFSGIDAKTVGAVALADLGLAFVGTLLAAMATASRARELLLPLLFLPLAIPIVVGGVGASVSDHAARYAGLLALYDVVFALLAWASFEYVVTE